MSEQGIAGMQLSETAKGVITIWLAQAPLPLSIDRAALAACARLAKAVADPARQVAQIGTTVPV